MEHDEAIHFLCATLMSRLFSPTAAPTTPLKRWSIRLIKVVVILVILQLLLAGIVKVFFTENGSTHAFRAKVQIKGTEVLLRLYKAVKEEYPSQSEGLKVLLMEGKDGDPTVKPSPQSERLLKDPWGRPFQYRFPGVHHPDAFDLFSLGEDGIEGTEDDVTNWQAHPRDT
jgi:general secretion pathway protein G